MQLSAKTLLVGLTFSLATGIEIRGPSVTSPVAVPVPAAPKTKLPTPHSHNGGMEKLSCKKLDTCLADHGAEEQGLKKCVLESLGAEKGEKAWAILSKAKLESKKKLSLALLKSAKVINMADFCLEEEPKIPKHLRSPVHVPVPKKTTVDLPKPPNGHPGTALAKSAAPSKVEPVKVPDAPSDCDKGKGLPTPHGHPEAAAKDKKDQHQPPPACQQLDACIAKVDQTQYTQGFKKCVQNFCEKLHAEKKLEKMKKEKDDPRTALCDKKGSEALDAIAKARTQALNGISSIKLMQTGVVRSLFAKDFTASEIETACRV